MGNNDWLYRRKLWMSSLYGKYEEKKMNIVDYQEDQPEQQEDYLMSIQEVARILKVDPTSVRRWIAAGNFKAVALPSSGTKRVGSYRVWRSELDNILSQ